MKFMAISVDEVKKIARLARLELTPAEEIHYASTISAVLNYMEILNEVDTAHVEPTYRGIDLKNVVRNDIAKSGDKTALLIAQMPQVKNKKLVVPGVFENPS